MVEILFGTVGIDHPHPSIIEIQEKEEVLQEGARLAPLGKTP